MRPTSEKILLALFNVLESSHHAPGGAHFLDLFAGSGKVGFKAHAMGAQVTAVEADKHAALGIKKAAPKDGYKLYNMDVRRALVKFSKDETISKFNIIFADPPYELGWAKELINLTPRWSCLLATGGVFVIEHSKREPLNLSKEFQCRTKTYGDTCLSFLNFF